MIKEARTTDPYISPVWKHEYPKIQILTIEDLLKGKDQKYQQLEVYSKKHL